MPHSDDFVQILQCGRQSLKDVVAAASPPCDGVPLKQWSPCNWKDLLDTCCLDVE